MPRGGADHSRLERQLWKSVQPYTFASREKLANLRQLLRLVQSKAVAGDIVECGTWRGGSAAVLGTALGPDQHLWLYDSFQGMPETSERDGSDARQYVGKGVASERDVIEVLTKAGVRRDQFTIRKGWFEESFKEPSAARICLLHCDADWYQSVLTVLETFYERVSPEGCIVLDDFGYWEGCREAFYDFCARREIRPLLERFGKDQAYWFKGVSHNRD